MSTMMAAGNLKRVETNRTFCVVACSVNTQDYGFMFIPSYLEA